MAPQDGASIIRILDGIIKLLGQPLAMGDEAKRILDIAVGRLRDLQVDLLDEEAEYDAHVSAEEAEFDRRDALEAGAAPR